MSGRYIYDPVDMATLLLSDRIVPGDTIIKLGEEIDYDCDINFSGSALAKVVFKPYYDKGIFKGGFIHINGHDIRFENIEFSYDNWVKRTSTEPDGSDSDLDLTKSFEIYGYSIEFYRCIIRDFSDVGSWNNALNVETKFTECLIYYNGWQSVDRGHGYNMYGQNNVGRKILERCIIFSAYRNNIHFNASTKKQIGFDIIDCINFGAGSVSDPALNHQVNNYIIGSAIAKIEDIHFIRNEIYGNARMTNNWGIFIGFLTPSPYCNNFSIIDNYIDTPNDVFTDDLTLNYDHAFSNGIITGNYFYGSYDANLPIDFPLNTYGGHRTSGKRVRVIKCDGDRAHIAIYNYDLDNTVDVDLTGVLVTGNNYQLINVQDKDTDIITGVVGVNNTISVPMTGRTISNPILGTNYDNTFPKFGCFIIEKI